MVGKDRFSVHNDLFERLREEAFSRLPLRAPSGPRLPIPTERQQETVAYALYQISRRIAEEVWLFTRGKERQKPARAVYAIVPVGRSTLLLAADAVA